MLQVMELNSSSVVLIRMNGSLKIFLFVGLLVVLFIRMVQVVNSVVKIMQLFIRQIQKLNIFIGFVLWCLCLCVWVVCVRVLVVIFQFCFVNFIEMLFFQFFDFCNWYVVIYVFVKVFNNSGCYDVDEVGDCYLLDMLDYGEIKYCSEGGNYDVGVVVFWYMNFFIVSRLFVCFIFFFYFLEGIMFVNLRNDSEVVEWWWRRGCLFQCMVILWVIGQVVVLIVVVNRYVELNQLVQNIVGDQCCIVSCNNQYWVELWIDLLVQMMGYIYEVQYVQWYKCYEEVDDLELESVFVSGFVQGEVKGFWLLVGQICEVIEYYVVDDNVMEVCNQEQVVVQNEVCVWYCQQYVGYFIYGEGYDKVDSLYYC